MGGYSGISTLFLREVREELHVDLVREEPSYKLRKTEKSKVIKARSQL